MQFLAIEGVFNALVNSLIAAGLTVVFSVALGAPAGYALARYYFPGQNAYRLLVLLTRAFPLAILALPLTVSFIRLGLYDTPFGVSLIHTVLALPFAALVTQSLFMGIPREYEEAAWVFGCTRFQAFMKVVLPLALAGPCGNGDLRLRDLLERGLRGLDPDRARAHAHRLSAQGPLREPAALPLRGRLHPHHPVRALHLRGADDTCSRCGALPASKGAPHGRYRHRSGRQGVRLLPGPAGGVARP